MDILATLIAHNTVVSGVLLLILGLWTWYERREKPVHQTFAALLIASSLWLFTFVLWSGAVEPRQELFWIRMLFFAGSFLPTLFLLFTLAFIGRWPRTALQGLVLLPNAALYVIAYHTSLLVVAAGPGQPFVIGSGGKAAFALQFGLTIAIALGAVLRELRKDPAFDKGKLAPLVIGAIVSFQTIFTLLFVARIGEGVSSRPWLESVAVFALVAGMLLMAYMVDSRKFVSDLRPVGGELFILVVVFLVSMDIAVAKSPIDLSVRIVVLILLVIYGASTVKTATREVQRLRLIGQLHDQLVKVNGRLIEADKLKTRFVSFASHQLRAPIGGIRSYLDLLRRGDLGPVSEKQKNTLDVTMAATERLADTVETFLDVAKIELGSEELYKSETNIAALIGAVVSEIRPVAEKKGIDVAVAVPIGLPNALCDSGKLYHAIANLVQNALKYTDKGGVTVSASAADGRMTVKVADSGVGLSDTEKAQIVELLRGGLRSVHFDASGGSGLGLFIVKSIVDAHGGEMIVESPGKGHGSVFGFRLPIA